MIYRISIRHDVPGIHKVLSPKADLVNARTTCRPVKIFQPHHAALRCRARWMVPYAS
jgi:hypothetical protein